jgi:hypothetical protein
VQHLNISLLLTPPFWGRIVLSRKGKSEHDRRQPFWIYAVIFGVIVLVLGQVLDIVIHWFYREPFSLQWRIERIWVNFIEGALAGIVAYFILSIRERRIQRRLREIGYLNHHIRNALSAIVLSQEIGMDTKQRIGMVRDSSDRIQRCLSKVSRHEDVTDYADTPQEP